MNLAKALKEKNRLAGEVALLKERLKEQNCRAEGQPFGYDNRAVLAELRAQVDALVAIKTGVAVANTPIYERIFRLAELKGLVALLRSLDTREGVFKEAGGYATPATETTYRSQLGRVEIDQLAADLDREIQALQDALDQFNFSHRLPSV